MITYEEQLNRDVRWALQEGSMHFEKTSAVHQSLARIARRLDEIHVPYVIVGGMALFFHGLRRFTEDVDILVTQEDLKTVHDRLEGLGYVPPYQGSKHLRDAESGVRIEFLTTGDYPGDGKEKPVAFPNPRDVAVVLDGIRFLSLPKLIELKLASGMSNLKRGQDLIDVQRLIEELGLPEAFVEQLNPYVQDKFRELWAIAQMPG